MRKAVIFIAVIALMLAVSIPVFADGASGLLKSGLVGAATGAVAAGASHGQAGKGALIGAGTGIAASVIADALIPDEKPAPQPVVVAPAPAAPADTGGFERGYTKGYEAGYQAGYQAGTSAHK